MLNTNIELSDASGISVEIIKDSVSYHDSESRVTTYRVVHPRFILAEMNKHRQLANNYQSSRAVPIWTAIKEVWKNPVLPIRFMKNKPGMVAKEDLSTSKKFMARFLWIMLSKVACIFTALIAACGLHKQWTGRLLEPFEMTIGIITATEWDNFFHLRRSPWSQPEFGVLADLMYRARTLSTPEPLKWNEWHLPFIESEVVNGERRYYHPYYYGDNSPFFLCQVKKAIDEVTARQFSAACIAQVSFRKLDAEESTLLRVYGKLVDQTTPHSVCLEHTCRPVKPFDPIDSLEIPNRESPIEEIYEFLDSNQYKEGELENDFHWIGVTHTDVDGSYRWSGCFKEWIQGRHLLPNESCKKYIPEEDFVV